MIDIFVQIMDKLIEWIKLRNVRKRCSFEEIARPMFTELEKINQDYVEVFRDCLEIIQRARHQDCKTTETESTIEHFELIKSDQGDDELSDINTLRVVTDLINSRRLLMLPARAKVEEFADTIYKTELERKLLKEESYFYIEVLKYFAVQRPGWTKFTETTRMMTFLNEGYANIPELSVQNETEARKYVELEEKYTDLFSPALPGLTVLAEKPVIGKKRLIVAEHVINKQIKDLNKRWQSVCKNFILLQSVISNLE